MRRRLDLAAALVHRPPVLFLDEPTTGLDPQSRSDLWATVRELVADGTTVLLTTQYLEEADQLANRIVLIDKGAVVAEGASAELKSRIGSTVVELSLADEGLARGTVDALEPLDLGALVRDGEIVRLSAPDGTRALIGTMRALDARGIEPLAVAVREPSLDDVFLTLTGHHATAGETPEEVAA